MGDILSTVTKHALRVYTALQQLRGNNADILDSLIPFFDPILEQLNNTVLNPAIFARGVHHLYRWRFNKDIVEQFIPRLERKGLLEKQGDGRDAVYIVRYQKPAGPEQEDILRAFEAIIDDFEKFPPRITDLLTYDRTREQLKDILLRFLVAMDAYGDGAFQKGADAEGEEEDMFAKLEEGGTPLPRDDRYMAARFVKEISRKKPHYVPYLARLASIGLLTEVVEDFLKPIQRADKVSLTIVVDAPLALDYLGCSGKALQDDVRSIFDALRKIGCNFVVFPASCNEMQRNLESMLALPAPKRHGYTHEALARGEVMLDFVEAVASDPEGMLAKVGISTKPLTIDQYPNSHVHFDHERYEDFFASVHWVQEVEPREHDASCVAMIMRLREGRHNSDLFKTGYVFVTRNARFVRASRKYCVDSRLISPIQQGPVIHQRELATLAWLRTGLGAEDEQIPRSHLLATCDRVLHIRSEVPQAVANVLRKVTPEKLEQFELLLLDHRSIRKLADETLNDETVVTSENAGQLLDLMRKATAAEERTKYEEELRLQEARHRHAQRRARAYTEEAEAERDEAMAELAQAEAREVAIVRGLIASINRTLRVVEWCTTRLLVVLTLLASVNFFTGWLGDFFIWKVIVLIAGALSFVYFIMNVRGVTRPGITHGLDWLGRFLLQQRLDQLNIDRRVDEFELRQGRLIWLDDPET